MIISLEMTIYIITQNCIKQLSCHYFCNEPTEVQFRLVRLLTTRREYTDKKNHFLTYLVRFLFMYIYRN